MQTVENGVLYVDGCNTLDLAKEYGTPLFVYSEDAMREKFAEIRRDFLDHFPNTRAAYAGKAFLTVAMCQLVEKEGFYLEVLSMGELHTALKAGFPMKKVEYNGNNKSIEEIEAIVNYGVERIIIDGVDELELIENICAAKQKKIKALIRISPGVDIDTHRYITTGNKDSKFGIPLAEEVFYPLLEKVLKSPHVTLLGFHFHLGSQINDNQSYLLAVASLIDLIKQTKKQLSFVPSELNIGGGFGIRYTEEDDAKPYYYFLDPIMSRIEKGYRELGYPRPTVVIEPGRSIVGNAGLTLYEVGTIKNIPGIRTYLAVNGGMSDNIRTALYQAKYECCLASKADQPGDTVVTVVGKHCESGDILVHDVSLPAPHRGDILAIYTTGAYCYAMASNYNKTAFPAVVFTSQGKARCVVKRQTYEELIARELDL